MKHGPKWSTVTIALSLIVMLALVSPALGGPSLRKLVRSEVAKQIAKATGPAGANGTNGANGGNGTARAYAAVTTSCSGAPPAVCSINRAKGVTAVTRPSTGQYCVTVPGIDSPSVAAAVTVWWSFTASPEGNASAMTADASDAGCAPDLNAFGVVTERHGAGTDAVQANDVAFTIVIP
jgi:hypothetical protein